jgi:phosphoglucosamine mutase
MLEAGLAAGIAQGGGDALIAGVLPTPAASILVRRLGLDLAVVVSASHNPWADNGIKFFGRDGTKLSDESEARVEASVESVPGPPGELGAIRRLHGAHDDYLRELDGAFQADLGGVRVVLDCANGSTHRAAPEAFRRFGAEVEVLCADPDGRNINEGCGSTHPEGLAERVTDSGADLGFAYDGDGDRVIAVDGSGTVRDGDELIALVAGHLRDAGSLGGGVAVTVMSNYGFHAAMRDAGIDVATTPVGDRHVSFELGRRGWTLGGEQSGHLIWTEFAPTGDGIAASLLVTQALAGRPLRDAIPMTKLPQTLLNVEVDDIDGVDDAAGLWTEVERESAGLEGRGRVLVRPSGTQPLVRVMVEAPAQEEADEIAERLAQIAARELG